MITAYHATTIAGAKAILESGEFAKGTYFAYDPDVALSFASPILFVGQFEESGFSGEEDKYQFWLREARPLSDLTIDRHWSGNTDNSESVWKV